MRWSKLKQRIEENFAPEISERARVHLTRHRGSHDQEQHGRIIIDGDVWFDACTFKSSRAMLDTVEENTGIRSWGLVDQHVIEEVKERGFLEGSNFSSVLFAFLNTSVEDALSSGEPLMRVLAVMDKRVGKRTLNKLLTHCSASAPERKFIEMRLSAHSV